MDKATVKKILFVAAVTLGTIYVAKRVPVLNNLMA